jgi:hypothetical protein
MKVNIYIVGYTFDRVIRGITLKEKEKLEKELEKAVEDKKIKCYQIEEIEEIEEA